MDWKKPDEAYWENKIIAYFHDPIDKIFDIKYHENRANEIIKILLGTDKPNNEFWKPADATAACFERGLAPSYNKDEYKSGAVNFIQEPVISHPTTSKSNLLNINLPENIKKNPDIIFNEVKKAFQKERDRLEKITDKRCESLFNKFTSMHLYFRFYLASENIGGLGGFWHRIPADTRFPDHSIWQHNAVTSAISSCMNFEDKNIENVGMMVFSITPVQFFISKARKLRDFWIGSLILSWLAFEGIVWVIENLGCDHIIYPSLIDQNLMYEYLKQKRIVSEENEKFLLNKDATIASFPNKFLFFIPFDKSSIIGEEIKNKILQKWNEIKNNMMDVLTKDIGINSEDINEIFDRQFENYWELNWSATQLLHDGMKKEIENLLDENQIKENFDISKKFTEIYEEINKKTEPQAYIIKKDENRSVNLISIGALYSASHSLVQSLLASTKSKKRFLRNSENGEKCSMCGEFEVVNDFNIKSKEGFSAADYNKNIRSFWNKIVNKYGENEIKKNEKLCSICLSKRLFKRIIENPKKINQEKHILYSAIKDSDSFPQTTEIALYDYFKNNNTPYEERKKKAQEKFDNKKEDIGISDNRDNYYAILKMDGDRMGDLINGETLGSSWKTILHPNILEKINKEEYFKDLPIIKENWKNILEIYNRRMVTPSIHLSISESLGDFSNYGVTGIINKYDGRLIYAGGDDVCAVLPLSNVLNAAFEIQKYYKSSFKEIIKSHNNTNTIDIEDYNYKPKPGKISINLGQADNISISAGILICHYKENLSHMIEKTEKILDEAKEKGKRNAVAICLKKRSGGERYFISKWSEEKNDKLMVFNEISKKISKEISHSLIYNLEYYIDGLNAILNSSDNVFKNLSLFIESLLKKSDTKSEILKSSNKDEKVDIYYDLASKIVQLIVYKNAKNNKNMLNLEPLIIASFLSKN